MTWLVGIGLVLVLTFSVSISLYLVNYKLPLGNIVTKTLAFLLIGALTFSVVCSLLIFMVWPPHIWDIFSF